MTEVGFIIQPGESIPEDVTGMRDRDDDPWAQSARGHWHTRGWHRRCDATCSNGGDPTEYAPLTVTAVREQPAEPEPRCPECGCTATQNTGCDDSWHSPDVLDLVRQYRGHVHGDGARELFARIEAEVNRLRAERDGQLAQTKRYSQVIEHQVAELERLKPAPNAPVVLSLPEVPEGATALVGVETGLRFERSRSSLALWAHPREDVLFTLGEVLSTQGPVSVEMAPPEPTIAEDFTALHRWICRAGSDEGDEAPLAALRRLQKKLEVFDDKDSTR